MDRRQLFRLMAALGSGAAAPGLVQAIDTVTHLPTAAPTRDSLVRDRHGAVEPRRFRDIGIIGVGNAGRNALRSLVAKLPGLCGSVEIDTYYANSSRLESLSGQAILLGEGIGRACTPQMARELAIANTAAITAAVNRFDIILIVAGMGGSSGTGVAPVVAEIARRAGVFTIGVTITPFAFEGNKRLFTVLSGIDALEGSSDAIFNLSNERFAQAFGYDISQESHFQNVDTAFMHLHSCVRQAALDKSYIGVDFEDLRMLLTQVGGTALGFAVGSGSDRIDRLAKLAIEHPLMGPTAMSKAQGIYVDIRRGTGKKELGELGLALNTIQRHTSPTAFVISGTTIDPLLGQGACVCILATGIPNVSLSSSV